MKGPSLYRIILTGILFIQLIPESCQNHEVCAHFNTSIKLLCDSGKLLYVERLTFYNNTNCSGPFHCGRLQTNNFTGVYLACNQTGPCTIPFHLIPIPGDCGKRESVTVFVEYTCINTNKFHDMCQEIPDPNGNENELFFSTPDYPRLSPFNREGLCSCSIRGSNITKIRVLDLKFDKTQVEQTASTFVIEDRSNGTVYNKTRYGNTGSPPLLVYNEDVQLPKNPTSIIMNLTHGLSSSKLLVKVEGRSLTFRCNTTSSTMTSATKLSTTEKPTTTSSTMTSATKLSTTAKPTTTFSIMTTSRTSSSSNSSVSTESSSFESNTEPSTPGIPEDNDAVVIGSIIGVLLLLILVAMVIAYHIRRKRKGEETGGGNQASHYNQQGNEVQLSNSDLEAGEYSHLSALQRADDSATYNHLNPTYVNSCPQPGEISRSSGTSNTEIDPVHQYTHLSDLHRSDDSATYQKLSPVC